MCSDVSPAADNPDPEPRPHVVVHPGAQPLDTVDPKLPLHLAIGMFDGVHLGHQAVIRQAVGAAGVSDMDRSAVLTFDPHPSRVLHPESATFLLMPLEQRVRRMLSLGADHVFVQTFTPAFARREAADFLGFLITLFPGLKSLHVGANFRYGARRKGEVHALRASGGEYGVTVHAHERRILGGEPISSSRIRTALSEGRVEEANAMLGYPHTVEGRVITGRRIGRCLGFPTLNIPWLPEVEPRFGVYHVAVRAPREGTVYAGIANYGIRPTLGTPGRPLLEVHVLDPGPDPLPAPGEPIQVALIAFMRPEKAFHSVEALREQIAKDVDRARSASLSGESRKIKFI